MQNYDARNRIKTRGDKGHFAISSKIYIFEFLLKIV